MLQVKVTHQLTGNKLHTITFRSAVVITIVKIIPAAIFDLHDPRRITVPLPSDEVFMPSPWPWQQVLNQVMQCCDSQPQWPGKMNYRVNTQVRGSGVTTKSRQHLPQKSMWKTTSQASVCSLALQPTKTMPQWQCSLSLVWEYTKDTFNCWHTITLFFHLSDCCCYQAAEGALTTACTHWFLFLAHFQSYKPKCKPFLWLRLVGAIW